MQPKGEGDLSWTVEGRDKVITSEVGTLVSSTNLPIVSFMFHCCINYNSLGEELTICLKCGALQNMDYSHAVSVLSISLHAIPSIDF